MSPGEPAQASPLPGAKRRSRVWRADLIRLMAALPSAQADAAALLCGFTAKEDLLADKKVPPAMAPVSPSLPLPLSPPEAASAPLLRLEQMTFSEDANDDLTTAPPTTQGLTHEDLNSPNRSLFTTPRRPSLVPWSRLWPVLRAALQGVRRGRDLDARECLRRWGRGDVMRELPRVQHKVWAERVELWVDRSPRLAPFWSDQDEVCQRIRGCIGKSGLRLRLLDAPTQTLSTQTRGDLLLGVRPDREQRVLVLGDLGTYASAAMQAAWQRTARRLQGYEVHASALLPVPAGRIPASLARAWASSPWERGLLARRGLKSRARQQDAQRAERLLRLCSPAAYVHLGLLRALRRLLPSAQTDAATEADVFAHSQVQAADAVGLVLAPMAAAALRQQFVEQESPALQAQVSDLIRRWHTGLPPELLHIETLSWLGLGSSAPPPGNEDDALAFADRLGSSLRQGSQNPNERATVKHCARIMLGALPDDAYQRLPRLQAIFAGVYANVSGVRVPEGLTPGQIYSELVWAEERAWWSLRQVGAELVCTRAASSAWPSQDSGPGSPVAWLLARGPQIFVRWSGDEYEVQQLLQDGLRLPLRAQRSLVLRTDCSKVTIAPWQRERWARAAGRDRYGLWAEAELDGVSVRFRWIPPGRFQMGSPEDEVGRYESEGPQHEVTLTVGYWLADAPCTQALWQVVMASNPSRFVSADRPVEQVSRYYCQQFVQGLNQRVPGLDARLPSEAEWEHACRAGTEAATWLGNLEILGENNAPLLDEIAWYGGNSGLDDDMKNGWDSRNWPNKQYPHEKAGTHPVRTKAPNPLGLFDVLGNVYEWCMDYYAKYTAEPVTNPVSTRWGSSYVFRGGAWYGNARCVRAASRIAGVRDGRDDTMGFRLARGEGPGHPSQGAGSRSGSAAQSSDRVFQSRKP